MPVDELSRPATPPEVSEPVPAAAELAFDGSEPHPWLDRLFAARGLERGSCDLAVHADDTMLGFACREAEGDWDAAIVSYFDSGLEVLDSLRQIAERRFGGFDGVGRMLDFGSGYGRVTRFLVRELDPERLWVADLVADAVAFQRRRFGVHGLLSTSDPADLEIDERFDLIYVGSLMTHLPESRFGAWVAKLAGLLRPGGLLAFTVHDITLAPRELRKRSRRPILFLPESESPTLDREEYGSTWVTESFVEGRVEELGEKAVCRRIRRGVCRYQDLYLVDPQGSFDLDLMVINPGPLTLLERCRIPQPGTLEIYGWACHPEGPFAVERIEVELDGERVAVCTGLAPRPDLVEHFGSHRALDAEFHFLLKLPQPMRKRDVMLTIKAWSTGGRLSIVFLGNLDRALCEATHNAWRAKSYRVVELEERLEAMRQSRFWKLRQGWFAFKGLFGLGDKEP